MVYPNVKGTTISGNRYDYDEIEDLLSRPSKPNSEHHETHSEDGAEINDGASTPSDAQSVSDSDNDIEMMEESDGSERSSSHPHDDNDEEEEEEEEEPLSKEEREDELRDEVLEKLDQRCSRAEDARLWKLLGADPASQMDLEDEEGKLQEQAAPRKDRIDLVDWTSWTDYATEWETLGKPVPEEAFRANRRLGKGGDA